MNLEYPPYVVGITGKVFRHTVVKTYLKLKEIAQFKTYDEGYQRQRDETHEEKIIEYLENSAHRYLPDIIISIRHNDINFGEKNLLNNKDFFISNITDYNIIRMYIKTTNSLDHLKIVDGNHRVSAIKKLLERSTEEELADLEVGVTFILSHDSQSDLEEELALFYYLNSKAKPLLPNDYLNEVTESLDDTKAKEIDWWMYVFKKSNERLSDIFQDRFTDPIKLKNTVTSSCDYLAQKIEKDDLEAMPVFFDMLSNIVNAPILQDWFNKFITEDQLDTLVNIIFFINLHSEDIFETALEVDYFCDWLVNHAKLKEFDDFENLYQTYKEVYVPQDYKIFVAMEFADNDSVFSAIEGTIEKVSRDHDLPLKCIRIDKVEKGNTYQIMDEILKQIQHNRLLIADITNKNPNVYLEVGYAMGLAKSRGIENQIMLFVEDQGKDTDVGFDLQSYQQNRYVDTEDLRKKLESQLITYYKRPIE